jgi:flagellar biogenesis protein FliO
VVEVAGEYLLLGVTDHSVNLVKTLSLLDEDLNKGEASTVFEKVLDEKFPHGEEFEMGNPKDFLSFEKNQRKSGFIE